MRNFQKKETLVIGLVKLIFSKRAITQNIDTEKVEWFSDGLIYLRDILNDGCGGFDPRNFFYLEIDLFRKPSSERGDLEIGFPRDMIDGGVEGFDGGVNGRLNAHEDSDSQGDPYQGEEGPSLMIAKMTEGNIFEKMKEDHKIKCQMIKPK
jgi:hypothetical protein